MISTPTQVTQTKSKSKQVWMAKSKLVCNVVLSDVSTNHTSMWYFDSGCSRHIIGTKAHLKNFVE